MFEKNLEAALAGYTSSEWVSQSVTDVSLQLLGQLKIHFERKKHVSKKNTLEVKSLFEEKNTFEEEKTTFEEKKHFWRRKTTFEEKKHLLTKKKHLKNTLWQLKSESCHSFPNIYDIPWSTDAPDWTPETLREWKSESVS